MRAWSFSSLNMYTTCPRQYELTKVKNVIPYTETEATKWGSLVHGVLEAYLKGEAELTSDFIRYKPWADKIKSLGGDLGIEWQFALSKGLLPTKFNDDAAWCRGIIDVKVVNGNKAFVGDWKTGKVRPDSDQLKLFAAATMQHHPEVNTVKTAYMWLAHDSTTQETYTRTDLPAIWQHFMVKVARLESSYEKNRWVPKPSGLCNGWCGAGKAHCEFWAPRRISA